MTHTIGKCSLCGGAVQIYTGPFFGQPPPPSCVQCHAVRDEAPEVIPMRPQDPQREALLKQQGTLGMTLGTNWSLGNSGNQ